MTTAETLRAAAQLLRERGWTRRYYRGANGCHCALGALRAVYGIVDKSEDNDGESSPPEMQACVTVLRTAMGGLSFARWNDAPDRTVDDVLAAFDRAAILAEGTP